MRSRDIKTRIGNCGNPVANLDIAAELRKHGPWIFVLHFLRFPPRAFAQVVNAALRIGIREPAATHSEGQVRSEEHTSELQSPMYLVCRLLLEKKPKRQASKVDRRGHHPTCVRRF